MTSKKLTPKLNGDYDDTIVMIPVDNIDDLTTVKNSLVCPYCHTKFSYMPNIFSASYIPCPACGKLISLTIY